MANRYLRASGNWNGPVWASTSDGVAGSAATPVAGDSVYVNNTGTSFSLTINQNVDVVYFDHTAGTVTNTTYSVTCRTYSMGAAATLNMGSGTWTVNTSSAPFAFEVHSSATLNAGQSLLVINATTLANTSPNIVFGTASKTFNDVVINLSKTGGSTFEIAGSPTFNSLSVYVKNTAAHTIVFNTGATVTTKKLVAVGASSTNRLRIWPFSGTATIAFTAGGTSYGQFVNMYMNSSGSDVPKYIGSSSTDSTSFYWVAEDPPKISTLEDPLTTAPGSNANWDVDGTVNQVTTGFEGGGYEFTTDSGIITTDTFDIVNSSLVLDFPALASDSDAGTTSFYLYLLATPNYALSMSIDQSSIDLFFDNYIDQEFGWAFSSSTAKRYAKIEVSASGKISLYESDNGTSWGAELVVVESLDAHILGLLRSTRLNLYHSGLSDGSEVIGSINPNLNSPPSTTLSSPANGTTLTTTTPTLSFSATDPEGDNVTYQVEVSSGSEDPPIVVNALSDSDAGFSGTDPYSSGASVSYTIQTPLMAGGITYSWRVRAKDPSGSNTWGVWSSTRTMTTEAIAPTVTSGSSSSITTSQATVAGNVTSDGGSNVTERGIVYGLTSNPTTANTKKTVTGTTGAINTNITGLSSNTTYYWRAYATNSKGTSYGSNQSFTTLPLPPTVTTGTASGTSVDSITVADNGVTSNPDSQTITEYGVVYSTSPTPTTANSKVTSSSGSANYDVNLTSLTEDTTYYVRAYAIWGSGSVAYGSQITRKTQGRPSVALDTPANAGTSSLTKPTLDFTGVDADTNTITYQLQLHTSDSWTSPLVDVSSASNTGFTNRSDSKTDPFYSGNQIRYTLQTDLTRGSTYYWRVRGKDTNGSNTWGEWTTARSFTVSAIAPSVSLGTVYNVDFENADVDSEVTADGGASVTERGVVYSTSPSPTTAGSKVTSGTGTGTYTSLITGLTGSTTYYVRAYAINSAGTSYSSETSFTTSQTPSAPTVITGAAANTTDITSEFNGNEVTQDGTETVTERGIVFSDTNATPTVDDRQIVAPAGGLGTFSLGITGLDAETTYYVRAYAVNSIGTGYGDVETFTTEAPFVPDEGDGYWTWTPSGSEAVVGRSQSTPANSSADLMLEDLGLEDGETYTLYYSEKSNNNGETKMVLQWFDGGIKTQQLITPGTPHTFVYDTTSIQWAIRLFVTGASVEADNITATFSDMYLAKESEFSGYVPFIANGVTEVKIENNWLIDKQRSDVITTMFDSIEGLNWHPFKVDTEGLGWFEIGDRFTIQDDLANEYSVVMWNSKLTIDGAINETLFTEAPDLTETNYNKAGKLGGLWKRTQIEVDKNKQEIESLVEAVYDFDGVINTQFSEVFQDIDQVRTTIQGSGGVNLILNSVMYAFDSDKLPEKWDITGTGSLLIQASNESLTAGAVAGNAFTLSDMTATQRVTVRKDVEFIPEDDKTYYSLSAKVKKNTVGTAHIKLINRNETLTIDLPDQTSYYWDTVKLEEILPLDDYFDIEIYSDSDADLQVTDLILSPGKTKREWTQANGEVMNLGMSVTEEGVTVRSPQFAQNYTKITALGFEVHRQEVGGDRVFGFNDDETNVSKLKSDKQISMAPLRTVPIDYGTYKGWAFTLSEDN